MAMTGAIFSPFVFLVIAFGDTGVVIVNLVHLHLRTNKFGAYMKCLLILLVPIPIAIWSVIGVAGSAIMGVGYGFIWPVMETFKAISKEGSISIKLFRCFTDGTWTSVLGACTVVRDFADFSVHSYFSVMDGLLESKEDEDPIELKVSQMPGCILAAILGILVDAPVITIIVMYKSPVLLFKGWNQLIQDLIGRSGPFLETVCVPFAGFWILLWPIVVLLATLAGIISSVGFGCFAAVVAYQESSTKRGLLYVIASVSVFDEYTNDLLYLKEGSCFPRPKYRKRVSSDSSLLPVKKLHEQLEGARVGFGESFMRTPAENATSLNTATIWDSFFKTFEDIGKELLRNEAIQISDLDAWRNSKTNIINIGIPAYAFLECFLRSIKSKSSGFILRNNVEITSVNRPEGRVFDWLYEPMCIMKEQIKGLNLNKAEELYFYKHCLYGGDAARIESWLNDGVPPQDPIKRAQLEGLSRRLQGFCLTLSRLPTSRRRFFEVLKAIENEAKDLNSHANEDIEAAT
ncbi:uncharacterized membrane protein At3g27390-like [Euphorbia lathyris]|uniref:uncharacterized membrane protein At3g27390-like n=1 Tax=Euphorbia lathyris TaxID=212925 RepID=UPI003313BB94